VPLLAILALTALPPVLTMDDALRIFRERGFDLFIADAQVAAAQGDALAAGAVANPQLSGGVGRSFNYDPAACPGCSATSWMVGLTDPGALSDLLTGKRGLRLEVARAAVAAARLSREDALRALSLQVRQALLDGALQQAQLDLARELADSTDHTRALNQRRMQAGAISEAELARAEVAALQAQQGVDLAGQAVRVGRLQIAFLLGSREAAAEFTVDPSLLDRPMPPEPPPLDALAREALERRPDLLAASAQESRAEAGLSLARRQRVPDVALSAQYQQEGSGQNALQPPTVTLGLQLPLPLFYRQQGEIARAEAEIRAQQAILEKLRAQATVDVQSARAAVEANRRLVERMRARLLERARRARDLVQIQYEKGAASLLELLDAQRVWAQTRADYLRDLHDFWLAVYQLDAAVGRT
jgi:cobalt-zinc-cadmium efflux system outer membrane protein